MVWSIKAWGLAQFFAAALWFDWRFFLSLIILIPFFSYCGHWCSISLLGLISSNDLWSSCKVLLLFLVAFFDYLFGARHLDKASARDSKFFIFGILFLYILQSFPNILQYFSPMQMYYLFDPWLCNPRDSFLLLAAFALLYLILYHKIDTDKYFNRLGWSHNCNHNDCYKDARNITWAET